MRNLLAFVAFMTAGIPGFANPPDPTLHLWLQNSNIALAGEILSDPKEVPVFTNMKAEDVKRNTGFTLYSCRVKVTELFQYSSHAPPQEIEVFIRRYVDPVDEVPPALKKGSRCVFFLNWCYAQPPWVTPGAVYITSDPWYGVQRYNAKMAALLKAMGKRQVALPH